MGFFSPSPSTVFGECSVSMKSVYTFPFNICIIFCNMSLVFPFFRYRVFNLVPLSLLMCVEVGRFWLKKETVIPLLAERGGLGRGTGERPVHLPALCALASHLPLRRSWGSSAWSCAVTPPLPPPLCSSLAAPPGCSRSFSCHQPLGEAPPPHHQVNSCAHHHPNTPSSSPFPD